MKEVLICNEGAWRVVMSFAGTDPWRKSAEKRGIVMYEIGYFPQNNKHLGKKIGFQSQTHLITDKHEPIVINE